MEKEGKTILQDGRSPLEERRGVKAAVRLQSDRRGLSLARGLRMEAKGLRGGEGSGRMGRVGEGCVEGKGVCVEGVECGGGVCGRWVV